MEEKHKSSANFSNKLNKVDEELRRELEEQKTLQRNVELQMYTLKREN